ncbi:MAG: hypothetical protein COA66_00110 [Arcobacter sp.]|nr:MAG: hypothetical protein COA66_00110 [Arcobacter sp.]
MDIEEYKRKLRKKMLENREEFEGKYSNELNGLMGLSKAKIDEITPDNTDSEIYEQLITVVKEASSANLSQAQLKDRIIELGNIAIKISKKVPSIAMLF